MSSSFFAGLRCESAQTTSSVRLPSVMSLRKSLPWASASPTRFRRSSCSWKARPAAMPKPSSAASCSGVPPPTIAPATSGIAAE